MAKISIDKNRCKGCLLCAHFCPKKLIIVSASLNKLGFLPVELQDADKECLGCGMCAVICPDCCIEVRV